MLYRNTEIIPFATEHKQQSLVECQLYCSWRGLSYKNKLWSQRIICKKNIQFNMLRHMSILRQLEALGLKLGSLLTQWPIPILCKGYLVPTTVRSNALKDFSKRRSRVCKRKYLHLDDSLKRAIDIGPNRNLLLWAKMP